MSLPAVSSRSDDPLLGQAELGDPAPDMFAGRPALPPARKAGIGVKTEGVEQLSEKRVKSIIARSRALLLLYWFP